jgi:hypothetical protein
MLLVYGWGVDQGIEAGRRNEEVGCEFSRSDTVEGRPLYS